MLDDTIADVSRAVLLNFGEHAFGHVDQEIAQDCTVVVQAVTERVFLVQIAVQEILVENFRGVINQLGRLSDDQEEVMHRPVPAENDGDGKPFVNGLEVVLTHGGVLG